MNDLIEEIFAFQRQAFPDSTILSSMRHLGEEIVELLHHEYPNTIQHRAALVANNVHEKGRDLVDKDVEGDPKEEVADLFMLAIQAADLYHMSAANIESYLRAKLEKNRARKWNLGEDGVARHVPTDTVG